MMKSLMHYNLWMKQCSSVILNNFVVCYYQMRTSKRDLLCVFCPARTSPTELRLTLPYFTLPVLLIMAPFVLIEYLLAYLFLITDSRLSVLSNSSPYLRHTRSHIAAKCTAEPQVLDAHGNPSAGYSVTLMNELVNWLTGLSVSP